MGETKICRNCQRNNQMDSIICWYCNADIRNDYFQQGGSGSDDWISPIIWFVVVVLIILVFATIITPGVVPNSPPESPAPAKKSLRVTHWSWFVKSNRLSSLSFDVENASESSIENLRGELEFRDETNRTLKKIQFIPSPQPFVPGAKYSFSKGYRSQKKLLEPTLTLFSQKGELVNFLLSKEPLKVPPSTQ